MSFSLTQIFAMGIAYLSFFFLVAYFTELGFLPAKLVRHPFVYVLSLGVFASSWAIYGAIGFASDFGYNYLAYYLGISGAFMLAPILLAPILRLVKNYQLGSLADLLAFRYRSRTVGAAVTICMLFGIMPLLAMQIQAVADSIHVLNQEISPDILAFGFCIIISLFAILFGARHITNREKHEGLVIAIAFESLIKLIAMATIALFVLIKVFGGPTGLNDWLLYHPEATDQLYEPLKEGPWRSIIAAFFVAAVTTPHMFHMAFTENLNPRALLTASWGVPLYLLIMALAIPIILWGANVIQPETTAEYFTLGLPLALNSPPLAILAFIAGLSAASGVIIVCTLALSAMCLNHLVIPLSPVNTQRNLYAWLLWSRRALIAAIIIASYGFYYALTKRHSLSELGFLTFVATTQFVPGLLGVLFWATANRRGFLWGLIAGMSVWTFGLLLPLIFDYQIDVNIPFLMQETFPTQENSYLAATFALFINAMVFGIVSIMTEATPSEKQAAETCNVDSLRRSYRWELSVTSAREFIERLKSPLGPTTAIREVQLALHDLAMSIDETRPYALRRLRDQLETNLSGLLGPSVAHEMIDKAIPYVIHSEESAIQDIHFIESRLEEYQHKLTGLAAELDSLRRFHRQTLQDLPIGVCSLGNDGEVLGWNHALEHLTGIKSNNIVGSNITHLPPPWREIFEGFVLHKGTPAQRKSLEIDGQKRWLSLHKAAIKSEGYLNDGVVVVIEDQTEMRLLEQQLGHNERLASIGRLAAGVAHEIGNPITGIACLAQNLKYDTDNEESLETSQQILEQTQRVSRIVQSLVSFSHSGNSQITLEPVDIHHVIEEAIGLIKLSKSGKDYVIDNQVPPDTMVKGDSQKLIQVLINLFSNAIDASQVGQSIRIFHEAKEHTLAISVEDQGSGIPPEVLKRIYEPFVTTKDPGKGTGLGMALVYSIVEEHRGRITIDSPINSASGGTRVTITLPRYQTVTAVTPGGSADANDSDISDASTASSREDPALPPEAGNTASQESEEQSRS